MEVFLLRDVEKLGKRGDRVGVRNGYARNFLLPRSLAIPVTRENQAWVEQEKKRAEETLVRKKAGAEKLAERLRSLKLQIPVTVGEKDRLFGSVTSQDLEEALGREGISIDRKQIRLSEPIRSLGSHSVLVELHSEVKVTLQIEVVKKS